LLKYALENIFAKNALEGARFFFTLIAYVLHILYQTAFRRYIFLVAQTVWKLYAKLFASKIS